jgi:hypothetical protein
VEAVTAAGVRTECVPQRGGGKTPVRISVIVITQIAPS